MTIRNCTKTLLGLAAVAITSLVATSAQADLIADGTVFGLDFGPTATDTTGNNWVETNGTAAISAGFIHDLNGTTVDGVSAAFSATGGVFSNNDGPNADYAALQPATVLNPNFVETVMTDIAGTSGGGAAYTVTISGLDDSLTYDLVATSAAFASGGQIETLTINGGTASAIVRGSPTSQTFHSFSGESSNSGVLNLVFTQNGNNPIVNGILVSAHAVPEPSSLALFGLGSVMMLVRRRRG